MKRALLLLLILIATVSGALAQAKGVDQQNDRIRDTGNDRAPANNGVNQDVGTGRGIDFGRGRTQVTAPAPNPYRFVARRDVIMQAVEELFRERRLVLDTAASKPDEGILISQPFVFSRGAVVTQSELTRLAEVPAASARGWTRGRYTIIVEVQPIDATTTNVAVNARIEGRTDGVTGAEWVTVRSTGAAEQEFLRALVEKLTGGPPVPSAP